jgi:hypothetical protein
MPRSPRRRIRFASVASRIEDLSKPGWADASPQGLASATDARTTRFCRTQHPSSSRGFAALKCKSVEALAKAEASFVCALLFAHGRIRPANTLHADAAASTASHPASVTTRDPPLMRDETAGFLVLIWGDREENCFCRRDWTGQIALIWLGKLAFSSSV